MRTTLGTGLATGATLLALAGCGQATSRHTPAVDAARFGVPVVSLDVSGMRRTRVVGGTAAMRARARAILAGMGVVAIAEVRFGRPPSSDARFRRVAGPIWLATTVVAHGSPFAGPLRSQLAADGPLWQATVFANAYEASQPAGEPRLRGTSEALSVNGRSRPFTSETGPAEPYGGAAETDTDVRRTIGQAAARARFRVVSISLAHPNRQAATVVVRALRRARSPAATTSSSAPWAPSPPGSTASSGRWSTGAGIPSRCSPWAAGRVRAGCARTRTSRGWR